MVSTLKPGLGFAERLKRALGEESESAFAARCPAVSRPLLRKYLAGSEPGVSKAVAIAEALGVSVEWLATGREPMQPDDVHPETPPPAPAVIDEVLLERIAAGIAEAFRKERTRIDPLQLVRMSGNWYVDLVAACATPEERAAGLRAMLQQLRRELRGPRDGGPAARTRPA